jgi:hypothetical protein
MLPDEVDAVVMATLPSVALEPEREHIVFSQQSTERTAENRTSDDDTPDGASCGAD